jgi:hypothetical protein
VVSLNLTVEPVNYERLLQSSDLAIRGLLNDPTDPMAMSAYLWTYTRGKPALTNGEGLIRWGMAWVRRIFIEGRMSKRRDEDIASAALAVIALTDTPDFLEMRDEIKNKVEELLARELVRSQLPLRQASYGAILLYASYLLEVGESTINSAALAVKNLYEESISIGRLFGLLFCIKLIQRIEGKEKPKDFADIIESALSDPTTTYEDKIYLLQSLWEIYDNTPPLYLLNRTDDIIARAPMWPHHISEVENTESVDSELDSIPISHLYQAALLDIIIRRKEGNAQYLKEEFYERYRGRKGIGLLAFGFPTLLLSLSLLLLCIYVYQWRKEAGFFWLMKDYNAMTSATALLYLFAVLLISYLLIITPLVLWKMFLLLVIENIQSDQRLKDVLWRPLRKISLGWLTLVLIAIVVGIFTGILTEGVGHILGKP